jgi:hypothetical protein
MLAALLLTTLALIAIVAAYVGEWWTVHIAYSKDFPNDPESDRGFRILMVYWMSASFFFIVPGAISWGLGLILYAIAGLGRYAPVTSGVGRRCSALHIILGCYVLWLFIRSTFIS